MRYQFMCLCLLGLFLSAGCVPRTDKPADVGTENDTYSVDVQQEAVPTSVAADPAPSETTVAADASQDTTQPEVVQTEPVEQLADEAEEKTIKVKLGEGDLLQGIAGEGDLTIEQIKTWLANAENHFTIEPELPFGLAAAKGNITGIEANPMTKAKIELGRQLYFDTRLSSDNTISCASCHAPDEGFARHMQFGEGVDKQLGGRNSPVSYNRIVSGPQFWDGRAASLEEQAVGPIANPIEMGNTHENAVKTLKGIEGYVVQFEKIFPDGVTIDNVGRAIATFERAIVSGPMPYDYYEKARGFQEQLGDELEDLKEDDPELYADYEAALAGSKSMSDGAKRGRDLFFSDRVGCTACHAGANFADEKYHNLGVGMDVETPDVGRFEVTKDKKDTGAFKTPTVRNAALSAPYMHDGSQKTLEEVVDWYDKGGHPNPHLSDKVKKLNLKEQEKKDLVAFMKEGLTGEFPKIETGRLPQS